MRSAIALASLLLAPGSWPAREGGGETRQWGRQKETNGCECTIAQAGGAAASDPPRSMGSV